MSRKDSLLVAACLLFFLTLFTSRLVAANVSAMGLLMFVSLLHGSFREKLSLLKARKHIWFMLAFAIYILISYFISDNRHDGNIFLTRRLPLLLFPLTVGLLTITRELRDKILLGFAIITCVACLATLGWAIKRYSDTNDSAWLYNDALSYLIRQQSIYTSFFVNISIYIFIYFILYYRPSTTKKILLGVGVMFLFVISYLLASRNMMVILYLSLVALAFYIIIRRRKYVQGVALTSAVIAAVFLIFLFFPKTINRFKELTYTHFEYQSMGKESHYNMEISPEQWNGANFRLAAWRCGWEVFSGHPLFGVGLGDKKDELFKVYEAKQFQFAITTQKNVHNNYLDILLSLGIIGFLFFLLGWIVLPFARLIRYKDGLGFLIVLTFCLAMITENYFDRSIGAVLFGFFVPFLLASANSSSVPRKKFQ